MKICLILPLVILSHLFYFSCSAQNCSLTCPENIVMKADSGKSGTNVTFPAANSNSYCGVITYTPASGSFFKIGSTSVIVTTASGQKCSFTITITDNEPPSLSPVLLSSKRVWPANGRMKEVAVRYISADNANENSCVITVTSNDSAANGQDAEVIDAHLIRLRALRLPNGMARTYLVTVTCTDEAGNTTKRTTGISVAKNVSSENNR